MTLISEGNNWALLSVAVLLTNFNVIPASAPVFDDIVWGYAVPLAIPLLLQMPSMWTAILFRQRLLRIT